MTPAGTSNELDVQNGWEENTHTHTLLVVSYEESFPRNFGVGGVKTISWKISSGARSEDLGPSLTIQENSSRKIFLVFMQRIS